MSDSEALQSLPFDVSIRPFDKADAHFVQSSWLKCNRYFGADRDMADNQRHSHVTNEIYFKEHQRLIGTLASHARIAVACDVTLPEAILGYCCAEPRIDQRFIVHMLYVKKSYRGHGVGHKLLKALGYRTGEPILCTHWTYRCSYIRERYNLIYNPYLLYMGNALDSIYHKARLKKGLPESNVA